eukprot:362824-Chlamydomonas_euryale.AAC.7
MRLYSVQKDAFEYSVFELCVLSLLKVPPGSSIHTYNGRLHSSRICKQASKQASWDMALELPQTRACFARTARHVPLWRCYGAKEHAPLPACRQPLSSRAALGLPKSASKGEGQQNNRTCGVPSIASLRATSWDGVF